MPHAQSIRTNSSSSNLLTLRDIRREDVQFVTLSREDYDALVASTQPRAPGRRLGRRDTWCDKFTRGAGNVGILMVKTVIVGAAGAAVSVGVSSAANAMMGGTASAATAGGLFGRGRAAPAPVPAAPAGRPPLRVMLGMGGTRAAGQYATGDGPFHPGRLPVPQPPWIPVPGPNIPAAGGAGREVLEALQMGAFVVAGEMGGQALGGLAGGLIGGPPGAMIGAVVGGAAGGAVGVGLAAVFRAVF